MQTVLLLIHVFLAMALVGLVLVQRSEGGALGIGGGSMDGLVSARGAANMLTRWTGIIAACFIATSLLLAIIAGNGQERRSIVDQPAGTTAPAAPVTPVQPAGPSVPLGQ